MYPFDVERLERELAAAGIDVLLVTSRHNVRYLTGGYYLPTFLRLEPIGLSRYSPMLVIPRHNVRQSFYVGVSVPDVDEVQALEAFGPLWITERYWVPELRSRVAELIAHETARRIRQVGLSSAAIGIEKAFLSLEMFEVLRAELPEAMFVDATWALARARAVKTPRELAFVREAHERTARAIRVALEAGQVGETSRAVEQRLEVAMAERGVHRIFTFAAIGPSYNRYPRNVSWTWGHILQLDTVAEYEGYLADLARMASLGEAPALAQELFAACLAVQERVRGAIGPGVACREIYHLGWEAIRACRWGENGNFIAHGLGLVSNELPVFTAETTERLEAGMVVSIEAEYRHPAVGHIKLEDSVIVTTTGCEGIGDFGREWCTIPA